MLLGLVLWVVALNGGTLAINSAFDKDEGDVAYLRRPPHAAARDCSGSGWGSWSRGFSSPCSCRGCTRWLYVTCLIMSVLYSVPPMRLKAVAGADWIINLRRVRDADAARGVGEHGRGD